MVNMNVDLCGVTLQNPVTTASGAFGFGHEYGEFYDLSRLGGIGIKGITPTQRQGNLPPRIAETRAGILNSVGLQNPGIDRFIKEQIPFLRAYQAKIIANISGNTIEEYCAMIEKISDADIDIIEMNVSCPNVKAGGMAFGTSEKTLEEIVMAVKPYAKKPLFVKLSPNVTDIAQMARVAVGAGADGLSLINTLLGMRINIHTKKPILNNNMGGLSGPAVFPIAVRMVHQVRQAVSVPIIGMGGISTWEDAIEMMLAGADAIAVGTACFVDPYAPIKILEGIEAYCEKHGIANVCDISGTVELNNG